MTLAEKCLQLKEDIDSLAKKRDLAQHDFARETKELAEKHQFGTAEQAEKRADELEAEADKLEREGSDALAKAEAGYSALLDLA